MNDYYCVHQKYFDGGKIEVALSKVQAETRPANEEIAHPDNENLGYDEYCDYFDSREEAKKFAHEAEGA